MQVYYLTTSAGNYPIDKSFKKLKRDEYRADILALLKLARDNTYFYLISKGVLKGLTLGKRGKDVYELKTRDGSVQLRCTVGFVNGKESLVIFECYIKSSEVEQARANKNEVTYLSKIKSKTFGFDSNSKVGGLLNELD